MTDELRGLRAALDRIAAVHPKASAGNWCATCGWERWPCPSYLRATTRYDLDEEMA